jgi:ribonuclease PH
VRVFLASRNAKKLLEMRRILAPHLPDIEVLGLDDVAPFDRAMLDSLLGLAEKGCADLTRLQAEALAR